MKNIRTVLISIYYLAYAVFGYAFLSLVFLLTTKSAASGFSFCDVRPNQLAWDVAFLCPLIAGGISCYLWRERLIKNLVELTIGLLFIPLALMTMFFSNVDWNAGKDLSHEQVATFAVNPFNKIVGYRTDGGATTNYGILIYKEKLILPGFLKWVEPVLIRYPAHDVSFELDKQRKLHCKFSGSADDREEKLILL